MAVTPAGERTNRIAFLRLGGGLDDHGGEIPGWAEFCSTLASIFWGSGNERREAAREGASQAASFVVLATARTRGVTVQDRIGFDGGAWEIKGIGKRGRRELEFNAVRAR